MTALTRATGRFGERLAEQHFVSLGARILERNYTVQYAEIDLILEDHGDLVAVEVKTRDVEDFVEPEECVHPSQLRRIATGLTTFAQDNNLLEVPFRIDVVLVVIQHDGKVLRFDHLRNVFEQ
jgi:putative endonuclease